MNNQDRTKLNLLKGALKTLPNVRNQDIILDLDNFASILDIEAFLAYKGDDCLTPHQKLVVTRLLLEGYGEGELATELGISQQAISYALTAAMKKIYRHLTNPGERTSGPVFSDENNQILKDMYKEGYSSKEIAIAIDLRLSTVRNKIRYLRERGELNVLSRSLRKDKQTQRSSRGRGR